MKNTKQKLPITRTQFMVIVSYIAVLIVSNVIANRQILLFDRWEFTAAVLVFPFVYILSDIISEVFGYKWSRKSCYIAFAANIFAAIVFYLVCLLPAPSWFGDTAAFSTVLQAVPRVTLASLVAFVVGDFVNDKLFAKMKGNKDHKGYQVRSIVSSFFGQLVDSCVFLPLAFLGVMPVEALIGMILPYVIAKIGYEIIFLPVNTWIMKKASKLHQKELSDFGIKTEVRDGEVYIKG